MRKVVEFFKKFGWIIVSVLGFILGALTFKNKSNPKIDELREQREELKKEEAQLKKEQEKLEKEADEIAKEKPFNNVDNAAKFINSILKRKQ